MTRLIPVCLAVLFAARIAHADGTPPNGAELQFNKFFLQDAETGEFEEPEDEDAKRFYLNLAHCECSRQMLGLQQRIQYEITITASSNTNRPAEVWVGTDCANDQVRAMQCRKLDTQGISNIDTLLSSPKRIELSVFDFINPTTTDQMAMSCKKVEQAAKIWLLVDADANGSFEYYKTIDVPTTTANAMSTEVKIFDTLVPEVPTGITAESGEESIQISWDAPTNTDSIYMYQALCIDDEGEPVASIDAQYQTAFDVCGQPSGVELGALDANDSDGTPIDVIPPEFASLDNRFICGEATQTATSLTVKEIDNGRPYKVALLVMDRSGNVAGVWFNRTIVPKPVTDLWEDIHDRGSAVDGGCLLSQTYGEGSPLTRVLRDFRDTTLARTGYGRALTSAYYATLGKLAVENIVVRVIAGLYLLPLVIIALLWHALTLPGMIALFAMLVLRRRIKRFVLAVILLAPSLASADDFAPYWDTDENEDASLMTFPEVKWHVGVKAGPYVPEIDLQAGLNAATGLGPYEAMFGDYYIREGEVLKKHDQRVWQVLPMLDVDRVLWDGFGQVTVGGSIGYMQKSAYAYLAGTNESDPMRERSTAAKNTFRLIPAAATVGYRFTYLDDMYGIPVVPYVRGGLSYYVWWMKAPNGDASKVCEDTGADGMCANEDKAYGGSLGFQGSVGIAVRAERIDAAAATSMRSSGLMHAGFFAELSYAKVDGFGSDSKLSVGDNTWFAGVNFEF